MRATARMLGAVALVLAGCSGGTNVGKPDPGATPGVATIEGTVGGAGAQTLLVQVEGGPSTSTDAAGAFVLVDVPEGAAALRFTGGDVDVTLAIPPMLGGEYRRIAVTVSATSASEKCERSETEFRGNVEAIDAAGKIVTVAGREVVVSDATVIKEGDSAVTFDDLEVGQRVEVRGTLQADGKVAARVIRILPVADPNALVLLGTLGAKDGAQLTVSGLPVDASAAEVFRGDTPITVDDLAVGDKVLVRGVFTDGVIVASVVRVICPAGEPPEVHVVGKVTEVDVAGSAFTVGATRIAVDDETEWEGRGLEELSELEVDDAVAVEAVERADGSLLAKEVRRISLPPCDVVAVHGVVKAVDTTPGSESVTLGPPEGSVSPTGDVKLWVTADTRILRGTVPIGLDGLQLGEPAAAKAKRADDGTLTALVILVAPPRLEPVKVLGAVGAVDEAAGTVVIGDTTLAVDGSTVILRGMTRIGLADLVEGEPAVALGVRTDGGVLAKLIQVWPTRCPEFDVIGHVDAVGTDRVTIAGKELLVDQATVIKRGDVAIGLADLVVGETAWAHVTTLDDGSYRAVKIWVRPPK